MLFRSLDAVCITGGEPTLQADLPDLIAKIKELGYLVKLDTNGFRPDVLKSLVEANFIDYVAMDIKNCPARYGETTGLPGINLAPIEESVRYLLAGNVDFEFRTTVADELHDPEDFTAIGRWLQDLDVHHPAPKYFIQPYVDRESVLAQGLTTPTTERLSKMLDGIFPYVLSATIRGAD